MRLLVDNDLLRKLASCDLLGESLRALEVEPSHVAALPTAAYVLGVQGKRARAHREKHGSAAVSRIQTFLASAGTFPDVQPDDPRLREALNIEGIDAGEGLLLVAALDRSPVPLIGTGDKRFLRALHEAPAAEHWRQALAGHFACFEQVMALVWERQGYPFLRERVGGALHMDEVLSVIFSRGAATPEAHARDGLISYIGRLRDETGTLLSPHGLSH